MALSSEASTNHIYVIDDVISKSRSELVETGELEESVLCQIQSIWKTKMIQAGLISATIDTSSSTNLETPDPHPLPENDQFLSMDFVNPIKTDRDGAYIPQQDGSRDVTEPYTYDLNGNFGRDENEELLNEDDDDDDEEDALDDNMDIPHLVMCQFDKVKRIKNKWECILKSGIMQINGKSILFSKATGEFKF